MAITLSNTFVNDLLEHTGVSVADQIGGGTLVVYSGTPPAGPNEALSGNTALATFTFSAAASQGAPSGGVMNLAFAATTVVAGNTGTATFFRILNSGGTALVQGAITADFNLSSTTVTTGDNVAITGTPSLAWTTT
jgi:hypothetical protein